MMQNTDDLSSLTLPSLNHTPPNHPHVALRELWPNMHLAATQSQPYTKIQTNQLNIYSAIYIYVNISYFCIPYPSQEIAVELVNCTPAIPMHLYTVFIQFYHVAEIPENTIQQQLKKQYLGILNKSSPK